jgi:hypothetical protein
MSAELTRIYLERIEGTRNMRRYYYAYISPTFAGPRPEGTSSAAAR